MGKIKLNKIKLYAYHGCMDEEAKIGASYLIDVSVKTDFTKAAISDELEDAVDYVHLNIIVREEMAIRSKLIEHVANRILERMLKEIPLIDKATVAIAKVNPPIKGNIDNVNIIMSLSR